VKRPDGGPAWDAYIDALLTVGTPDSPR
jgi:hypothetical protein